MGVGSEREKVEEVEKREREIDMLGEGVVAD